VNGHVIPREQNVPRNSPACSWEHPTPFLGTHQTAPGNISRHPKMTRAPTNHVAIGLWTYGYNIMRNLGNRLTLHSPSRGFSMELGSAITVILATRLALPISTTQCITCATVSVGLCSRTWRAINRKMIAWIYLGRIITLPMAGIIAGHLIGIVINAPRWVMVEVEVETTVWDFVI
jgi:hypothetical protein